MFLISFFNFCINNFYLFIRSRLYYRAAAKHETDKEKLLLCYQINQQIQQGKFPITWELALELATLMAQVGVRQLIVNSNCPFILQHLYLRKTLWCQA